MRGRTPSGIRIRDATRQTAQTGGRGVSDFRNLPPPGTGATHLDSRIETAFAPPLDLTQWREGAKAQSPEKRGMAARTFFPNGELGRADAMNLTQWREGAKGAKGGTGNDWGK